MNSLMRRVSFGLAAGAALLVTGCASVEDVKHAQATADQALSTAQSAQSTAQAAQSAAQAAQQAADQNRSDINSLKQRVDELHKKGERG